MANKTNALKWITYRFERGNVSWEPNGGQWLVSVSTPYGGITIANVGLKPGEASSRKLLAHYLKKKI